MKKYGLLTIMFLLLVACNNEEVIQQETWNVVLSRTATNGQNVRIIGKKNGNQRLTGTLIPSSIEGGTAEWKGTKPDWPEDEQLDVYLISPEHTGDVPTTVNAQDGKTWMIDYLPNVHKPNQFTLTHLMAKLKVHIRISNDTQHQQPRNVNMTLYTEATIDYPNKKLKDFGGKSDKNVSLGNFSKDNDAEESTDNWVCNEILIIPQTLEKGNVCLTFTDSNGKEYTFTPEKDLMLLPGKVSHLFLGFAMDQLVFLGDGITITPWISETTNNGNAVEE